MPQQQEASSAGVKTSLGMMRPAAYHEIKAFLHQRNTLLEWEVARDFAYQLFGKQAHHVEVVVGDEYDDEHYFPVVEDVIVYDAENNQLFYDLTLPYWSQVELVQPAGATSLLRDFENALKEEEAKAAEPFSQIRHDLILQEYAQEYVRDQNLYANEFCFSPEAAIFALDEPLPEIAGLGLYILLEQETNQQAKPAQKETISEYCSSEGCWGEVIARNCQALLLGQDEATQRFIFRTWHSCAGHLSYYQRMTGEALYQCEKYEGQGQMLMFFLVTPQHLALARRLWITTWYREKDGSPGASVRRPYGNSNVIADIADIIGYRAQGDDERYTPEEEQYLMELHREMHLVLQIVLHTGQMKPGVYKKPRLGEDWVPVEHMEQEQELVLASSSDQIPVLFYKASELLGSWRMSFDAE